MTKALGVQENQCFHQLLHMLYYHAKTCFDKAHNVPFVTQLQIACFKIHMIGIQVNIEPTPHTFHKNPGKIIC